LNDFGGSVGGPILHDKLFFFGSLAIQKQPSGNVGNANVLTSSAQSGLYRYAANQNGVNVLDLAAANGFPNTVTSTTASGLSRINASQGAGIVTSTSDPNINNLAWVYSRATTYYYPNVRLDWNTTQSVRMNFSFNEEKYEQVNGTAPRFPGEEFADLTAADTLRTSYTLGYGLDWTVTPTVINQFRGGFLYYWAGFAQNFDESQRLSAARRLGLWYERVRLPRPELALLPELQRPEHHVVAEGGARAELWRLLLARAGPLLGSAFRLAQLQSGDQW
jgi:hypothetical protein